MVVSTAYLPISNIYLFFEFLGVANAGELRLNPNINRTIQHAGPGHSFFISCLPYSDEAQSISDSRFRAKELSWKKLRKVPVAEWVVMGSASHQRYQNYSTMIVHDNVLKEKSRKLIE